MQTYWSIDTIYWGGPKTRSGILIIQAGCKFNLSQISGSDHYSELAGGFSTELRFSRELGQLICDNYDICNNQLRPLWQLWQITNTCDRSQSHLTCQKCHNWLDPALQVSRVLSYNFFNLRSEWWLLSYKNTHSPLRLCMHKAHNPSQNFIFPHIMHNTIKYENLLAQLKFKII